VDKLKKSLSIPFARVPLAGNEQKYVSEVLQSGWLTTASKAAAFEKIFAEKVNAGYACAVNSGTAALHLGLEALGVKPGDGVFVPSMTFTASAEIVRYLQGHPVFLDVEYGTNLVTPEILRQAIYKHPEVRFLVIVHYGGQAAKMLSDENGEGILSVCKNHGIKVVEDAAHAFPAKEEGRMVGSLGDVTCFSFYANKPITTGEGGMLTTQDKKIFDRVKKMRLHGINRDIWDRFTKNKASWEYDIVAAGYKYNMPDIAAAIGLAQLEKAEEFRKERQRVAEFYYEHLKQLQEFIDLPVTRVPFEDHAWHLFPIVLKEKAPIGRNELITKLARLGIGTSVHYKPLYRMSYYKNKYHLREKDFPQTEKTWKGNISLPIFPYMSNKELNYIYKNMEILLKQKG
jgi:dTDP-4-amino-4,6-dideoxygalactose transaminase